MSEDLEKAFQAAQSFALVPVLKMLKESISFENNTGVNAVAPGEINLKRGDLNVKVFVDNVEEDYSIMKSFNDAFGTNYSTFETFEDDSKDDKERKEFVAGVVTHLLKSVFVVFNKLRENEKLAEFQLNMDSDTKIHLIGCRSYLSIRFEKCSE